MNIGTIRSNYIFNENDEEKKVALQTRTALAKYTFPIKDSISHIYVSIMLMELLRTYENMNKDAYPDHWVTSGDTSVTTGFEPSADCIIDAGGEAGGPGISYYCFITASAGF